MNFVPRAQIPVIDIFAGCGGLSEGFAVLGSRRRRSFDVRLALDMDPVAQQSLELRSFFHQFPADKLPPEYYACLWGKISKEELFGAFPEQAGEARACSLVWELGGGEKYPDGTLDQKIIEALSGEEDWVLLGGPPCQAYSLIGRPRNKVKTGYDPATDRRNFLYLEFLRILCRHWPAAFLMENVRGVQSASVNGRNIWHQMLEDLTYPAAALNEDNISVDQRYDGYQLYSLVTPSRGLDIFGLPVLDPVEYVVKCEEYGVPQTRHRVFVLGIRSDIAEEPGILQKGDTVTADDVLRGLPRLRSGVTDHEDSMEEWTRILLDAPEQAWWADTEKRFPAVVHEMKDALSSLSSAQLDRGGNFVGQKTTVQYRPDWFLDERLGGACNHETKAHMATDLHRYLFVSNYTKVEKHPVRLGHFPNKLLPEHKNAKDTHKNEKPWQQKFSDRFAALATDRPSNTVMSHMQKDGHYYIHYDATQCRSLTVREAARLQTFPDNYYLCGSRTEQYQQIGNAVPPLLSFQIAEIVADLFARQRRSL